MNRHYFKLENGVPRPLRFGYLNPMAMNQKRLEREELARQRETLLLRLEKLTSIRVNLAAGLPVEFIIHDSLTTPQASLVKYTADLNHISEVRTLNWLIDKLMQDASIELDAINQTLFGPPGPPRSADPMAGFAHYKHNYFDGQHNRQDDSRRVPATDQPWGQKETGEGGADLEKSSGPNWGPSILP